MGNKFNYKERTGITKEQVNGYVALSFILGFVFALFLVGGYYAVVTQNNTEILLFGIPEKSNLNIQVGDVISYLENEDTYSADVICKTLLHNQGASGFAYYNYILPDKIHCTTRNGEWVEFDFKVIGD